MNRDSHCRRQHVQQGEWHDTTSTSREPMPIRVKQMSKFDVIYQCTDILSRVVKRHGVAVSVLPSGRSPRPGRVVSRRPCPWAPRILVRLLSVRIWSVSRDVLRREPIVGEHPRLIWRPSPLEARERPSVVMKRQP